MERDEFDKKYGEQCIRIGGRHSGVLTVAGPELSIYVSGKLMPFEWHSYCGPIPLNKRGDPKEIGPNHKFWHAVTCWDQQGKRLDENRRAIWDEPPKEDLSKHVRVGRNLFPPEMHERLKGKVRP